MPDMMKMRGDIFSVSINDDITRATIKQAHANHGTLLEPHGAVGWAALRQYLEAEPEAAAGATITLETAHPAKFPEAVRAAVGADPEVPPSLAGLESKTETYGSLETDYAGFKGHLEKEYRR